MPTHDFKDIGDVLAFDVLKGTIASIDSANDTCMVSVGGTILDALLFYHCKPDSVMRDNGAIEGAAAGFSVDDEVIVLKRHDNSVVKVIGHTDGIRRCESGDYYFIHNFETAVDQPDYVWDMEYPDRYLFFHENTVLDPDAKFGNYACSRGEMGLYYAPDNTTDEFWPPLTYEFWFKASVTNGYLFGEIYLYGWLGKPEVGAPTQAWFDIRFWVTPSHAYMEDNVSDMYFNYISRSRYNIPFPLGEYVHYALVVLPDRIKVFYNGVLFKEYISPMSDGFNVMYIDFYLFIDRLATEWNQSGKILIDAFSIAKGAKYTENFTPPTEPPSV